MGSPPKRPRESNEIDECILATKKSKPDLIQTECCLSELFDGDFQDPITLETIDPMKNPSMVAIVIPGRHQFLVDSLEKILITKGWENPLTRQPIVCYRVFKSLTKMKFDHPISGVPIVAQKSEQTVKYSNGYMLEGTFINNKLNGKGKKVYVNGTIDEGKFMCNELNGKGKRTLPIGITFEGEFEDDELNGMGRIKSSSSIKEGRFRNGLLHGEGKVTSKDGRICNGEFKDGKMDGEGTIIRPDGTILEGKIKGYKLCGTGKVTYPDGRIDEGMFKNGSLSGQGKRTEGENVAEGQFKMGCLNGRATITYNNGTVISGFFKDGKPEEDNKKSVFGMVLETSCTSPALTKLTLKNGRCFEGSFDKEASRATGKMTFPNGTIHKGDFLKTSFDITLHGKSEIKLSNGAVFTGNVENDLIDGKGTIKFSDNRTVEGYFKDVQIGVQGEPNSPVSVVNFKLQSNVEKSINIFY
jgi:hypothetical protein